MCLFDSATCWRIGRKRSSPSKWLDQVSDRVQAGERMQRAAMMAGRQVGRTHHRERRSRQHGSGSTPARSFASVRSRISAGGRRLDELDQRFYGFRILDTSVHVWAPRRCAARASVVVVSPCRVSLSGCRGGATRGILSGVRNMVGPEAQGVNVRRMVRQRYEPELFRAERESRFAVEHPLTPSPSGPPVSRSRIGDR